MKKYIFLDIENPNCRNNSICSIGILVVENNQIIKKIYSLINPEDRFDLLNIKITGINYSMIKNSPTLKDYWQDIKSLLEDNIIVGHNIEYDLSVLSKALDRYDIIPPNFNYLCTYKLSKQYLNEESYKLEDLAKTIGYEYNAHNALEDAMASFQVFQVISSKNNINNYNIYNYKGQVSLSIDSRLESNINDLHGIIKGISYDGIINQEELNMLKDWIDNNNKYKNYSIFLKIISQLSKIVEDNIIDDYERTLLLSLIESINKSKIYNESTLALQILQGILKGIMADNLINEKEIGNLQTWILNNQFLENIYPYDKVYDIIKRVLNDGIISEIENKELKDCFNEILNPYKEISEFSLNNKTYCLSGDFKNGTKEEINKLLSNYGGIEKKGVSSKVDYLFVGSLGSDAWKYGNIGGKIAKAQELQEKGSSIKIVSEDELINQLNLEVIC